MLHRVRQVVCNFVRLLFGAGQIAYRGFISSFALEIVRNIAESSEREPRQ